MWALWIGLAQAGPCEGTDAGQLAALAPQIGFATGRADLVPDAGPALDRIACALAADPGLSLWIGVDSDSQGADEYNLRMTQVRADAVRTALISRGIDGARITALGYGETRPIADNATAEGRAANRRVELSTTPLQPVPPPMAPAPAPAPAPVDLCAAWHRVGTELPWPDCEGTARSFTCRRPSPPPVVAATAARCLGTSFRVDGPGFYVPVGGSAIVIAPDAGGSVVHWR